MAALNAWIQVEIGSPIWETWLASDGAAAQRDGSMAGDTPPTRLADQRGPAAAALRHMARLVGHEVHPEDLSDEAWWDLAERAAREMPDHAGPINAYGELAREAEGRLRRMHAGLSDRAWELLTAGAEMEAGFTAEDLAAELGTDIGDVRSRLRALGRSNVFKQQREDDVPWFSEWDGSKQQYGMPTYVRRIIRKINASTFPPEEHAE